MIARTSGRRNFNPRTPCGVRLDNGVKSYIDTQLFQSTHPLRGATIRLVNRIIRFAISIHAPLAGCDKCICRNQHLHVPFQSTHPLRGATTPNLTTKGELLYFNPRTPCGVRREYRTDIRYLDDISIHAPLAGCDFMRSVRLEEICISIHAPLAGCDIRVPVAPQRVQSISIHAPLAGCDSGVERIELMEAIFQSTHPLRGATISLNDLVFSLIFQSTHPLRGATFKIESRLKRGLFQSTHPLRGAT